MAWDEKIYTPEEVREAANKKYDKHSECYKKEINKAVCKITYSCNSASESGNSYHDCFLGVHTDDKFVQKDIKAKLKELGYKVSVMWWHNPIKQDWIRIRW